MEWISSNEGKCSLWKLVSSSLPTFPSAGIGLADWIFLTGGPRQKGWKVWLYSDKNPSTFSVFLRIMMGKKSQLSPQTHNSCNFTPGSNFSTRSVNSASLNVCLPQCPSHIMHLLLGQFLSAGLHALPFSLHDLHFVSLLIFLGALPISTCSPSSVCFSPVHCPPLSLNPPHGNALSLCLPPSFWTFPLGICLPGHQLFIDLLWLSCYFLYV